MNAPPLALVTGASGFIGRHLCQALTQSGARVRALLRETAKGPWAEAVCGDIAEPLPLGLMTGVATVYHLAGKAHALSEERGDEGEYCAVNIDGTRRVLDVALASRVRSLVLFSSVKSMGEGGAHCLDETCGLPPATPYGRSKLAAERLVLAAGESNALQVSVLRLSLVYGPGSKGNLARMLEAIDHGRFPPLPAIPNRRSMVHVGDVARAAQLVASEPAANGRVYVLTDNRPYATTEIYELMRDALGKGRPSWRIPRTALAFAARCGDLIGKARGRRFVIDSDSLRKLMDSAWYSSKRIEAELGFMPLLTLDAALAEMVRHYRKERAEPR